MIGGLKCTHEELPGHQKLKTEDRVTLSTTLLAQNPLSHRIRAKEGNPRLPFFHRDLAFPCKIKTDPNMDEQRIKLLCFFLATSRNLNADEFLNYN